MKSREIREKQYQSLSLKELREVAKSRGLKSITALKKEDLVNRMLDADEADEAAADENTAAENTRTENRYENPRSESVRAENSRYERPRNEGYRSENNRYENPRNEGYRSENNRYENPRNEGYRTENNRYENPRNDSSRTENARPRLFRRPAREDTAERHEPIAITEEDVVGVNAKPVLQELDSGNISEGILEVMPDGYGFIRSDNFMPGDDDVYVSPSQIRKFRLKTGDVVRGNTRVKAQNEKFSALLYVKSVNGINPGVNSQRMNFEDMTPIFPNERIRLERPGGTTAMRIVDLVSPIGKGQRGMIVSPPKAGKTTLLKDAAKSVLYNNPEMHIIILLIDERPEEVTDMKETVYGPNVEVIYSTFDEQPEHHRRVAEMVIERAKRLVENKQDVIIFIDSITRLTRAYNQVVPPSGRTLSGGLDPAALHMPKRFFGAARNMREGGSLTILATALVDTGSKMDDVVYEEFKGTGNMELILDRKLQERRVFPAIDLAKSGTRREDLLLDQEEQEAVTNMRKALNGQKSEEAGETVLNMFAHSRSNRDLVQMLKKQRLV